MLHSDTLRLQKIEKSNGKCSRGGGKYKKGRGGGVKIRSESDDYDSRAESHFLSCKVIMTWRAVYTEALEECKKVRKKNHI